MILNNSWMTTDEAVFREHQSWSAHGIIQDMGFVNLCCKMGSKTTRMAAQVQPFNNM
jgi:hypothetical protein